MSKEFPTLKDGLVETVRGVARRVLKPISALVGVSDRQTLTNKTINADNNTITNIGKSEVEPGIISDQDALPSLLSTDSFFIYRPLTGELHQVALSVLSDYLNIVLLAENCIVCGASGSDYIDTGTTVNHIVTSQC